MLKIVEIEHLIQVLRLVNLEKVLEKYPKLILENADTQGTQGEKVIEGNAS